MKARNDDPSIPITGNFIKLFSEGYFDFTNPESSNIAIEDIAVGLSNTCRFAGQLEKFYSVAEHSLHCLSVAIEMGCTISEKRAVFMHDAAEAYVGDVPSPLKILLPEYKLIENRIEAVIFDRFNLEKSPVVKQIDLMLLRAEKQEFMGGQDEWHCLEGIADCSSVIDIQCLSPAEARKRFLIEANFLGLVQ